MIPVRKVIKDKLYVLDLGFWQQVSLTTVIKQQVWWQSYYKNGLYIQEVKYGEV